MVKKLSILLAVLLMIGCGRLLPTVKQTTASPWHSFNEAKEAFDKITPHITTSEELKKMGFDPFSTPNIKILNYLDIARDSLFIGKEDVDEGIQQCIKAKAACRAYEFEPQFINKKRSGNFWLDFFNFKRKINEKGWRFKAFIIVVNDTVVYKLWGGNPSVNQETEIKNPLGPLQDAGDILIKSTL
ncbi:MAG: hypothetical protein AB1552_09400 [Nitrospirota bacterium]